MASAPLIAGYARDAVLGMRGGQTVRAGAWVAAAKALAERLPEGDSGWLLCHDRLAFALGLAAMLVRGTTALLPPANLKAAIERITGLRRPTFALVDREGVAVGVPTVVVDPWTAASAGEPADDDVPSIDARHIALIGYTSGTTGDPQPHAKSWSSLVRAAAEFRERIGVRGGDAFVGAVPAQHMWGLEATVMLPMQSGGIIHAGSPLLPSDIAAALAQCTGRRWLVLTPLHVRSCVRAQMALPNLTAALTATSPLDAGLAQRFEQVCGAPAIEIYGATEAGVLATRRPAQESAFTLMDGLSLSADADGLVVRSGHLDAEVRLRDRVEVAADGRFTLAGRDADLVKVGGKRASLAMLNRELIELDGVIDGAFVVLESGGLTPRLAALAVAPGRDSRELVAALRERIDAVFLPRPLRLVDAIPRDRLGKVPMEQLRALVLAATAQHSAPKVTASEVVVPATHPALPGHFPGRPIVPAAWLLTLVAAMCERTFGHPAAPLRLKHARFRAPLAPGMSLLVRLEARSAGEVAFTCSSGDTRIADGVLAFDEQHR